MDTKQLIQLNDNNVMSTYGRFPISIVCGEGAKLYDEEGKEYIDFAAGIGTSSIGHAHPRLVAAVSEQAGKICHSSNLYYTEPAAKLAEILCRRGGMKKVFFANSGAEANEGAIKLARKYSSDKYGEGRGTVVSLMNSFHGRTMTTITATGQPGHHTSFYPFPTGHRYAIANDLESVQNACGSDACAVIMELVQGEGGVLPLTPEFVRDVEAFCKARDLLLILDEVQTGIGRTGRFFAFQAMGVQPDVVTFAKGVAGGLPIGGFLANETCADVLTPGTHGATFGGNPVAAAAALAVMEVLSDEVIRQVNEKGAYIREQVDGMGIPFLAQTRGLGLMIGIPVTNGKCKELAATLNGAGLLTLTAGADALRFLPPLTITRAEMDAGLAIFKKVMEEAAQ